MIDDKVLYKVSNKLIGFKKYNIPPFSKINVATDNYCFCILVKNGYINYKETEIKSNDMLMVPDHQHFDFQFKSDISEGFDAYSDQKTIPIENLESEEKEGTDIEILFFESKIFNVKHFFSELDIKPFKIKKNKKIKRLFNMLSEEIVDVRLYKDLSAEHQINVFVIEILRYITENSLFLEELATLSGNFKDPRLNSIFDYIHQNLDKDLHISTIAEHTGLNDGYIGQYFKAMAGINLKDYIEYQRMEKALELLKRSSLSIRDIGLKVGYSDYPYFCRRFKLMYGIPAGQLRSRGFQEG